MIVFVVVVGYCYYYRFCYLLISIVVGVVVFIVFDGNAFVSLSTAFIVVIDLLLTISVCMLLTASTTMFSSSFD